MSGIVVEQPLFQIRAVASVEAVGMIDALENVRVEHFGLPSVALNPCWRDGPPSRRRYGGHHPSLQTLRVQSEGWWSRGDSNP